MNTEANNPVAIGEPPFGAPVAELHELFPTTPKAPHPANIGIEHARVLEKQGYSRDAAVAWLFENYPQHFETPTDARNAYEAG